MPKIDIARLVVDSRTGYPPPFDRVVAGRERKRLGNAAGLDQFGVNLTTLGPGASSSLRHRHEKEDELIYMLEGEVVLIEDGGETLLRAGDAAGFKANSRDGHHLVNRTTHNAVYLEIGSARGMNASNFPTSISSRYAMKKACALPARTAIPMRECQR